MDYAEEHGNRSVEKDFGVSEKVLTGWRKQKDQGSELGQEFFSNFSYYDCNNNNNNSPTNLPNDDPGFKHNFR